MQSEKLDYLINTLISERNDLQEIEMPEDEESCFRLYRSLVNIRPAIKAGEDYLKAEDEYLRELTAAKGITDTDSLAFNGEGMCIWQGDITTLRCDAIVNAANSGMTGCWQPCHSCIDNCIHTFAGVRLRMICDEIMSEQGHEEPTGHAKITPAYNLPCRYVLHTVGPIVSGRLTDNNCRQLWSSYNSCLELAEKNDVKSIAFCCISTGVFGFPQQKAAEIAVAAVREYKQKYSSSIKVIFNVFKNEDLHIYRQILK